MGQFPNKDTQFKPGESGNPDGRPPGIPNWSTVVQELLADENLAPKLLKKEPGWWSSLPQKNGAFAVTAAMMIKAMNGDATAAKWLRETGWGNKLDVTSDGQQVFKQMDDEQLDQYIARRLAGREQPGGGADRTAK